MPGRGATPPYLAGRESQQRLIAEDLDGLADGSDLGSFMVLYGPRGNGKTVLLEWAVRQAKRRKIRVVDISMGESEFLEGEVAEGRGLPRWLRALSGISILGMGINWREEPPSKLTAVIQRQARKGPLMVAVDEAHTMPVSLGRALLSVGHRLQRQGLPAMVQLAGTPDVLAHLKAMGASYWERSEQLPIGQLRPAAIADAIRIPLKDRGRSIGADALRRIVEESHGYPFLVQLWGKLPWKECTAAGGRLKCADLERVSPQ